MNYEFDARDQALLDSRKAHFDRRTGPRVGDYLQTPEGLLRFTHDWGDRIQTTVKPNSAAYSASFYLEADGFASFSGSLDSGIEKSKLRDTGATLDASFWFFHHDVPGAGRGVEFRIACRVFEVLP